MGYELKLVATNEVSKGSLGCLKGSSQGRGKDMGDFGVESTSQGDALQSTFEGEFGISDIELAAEIMLSLLNSLALTFTISLGVDLLERGGRNE